VDGTGATTLITLASGANPRGIAVDHAGAKLYWADFDLDAIFRANLDGTGAAMWIALPPGSGPYGVAVDPAGGFVYWTEFNTGLLKRATTAGGGVTTLVSALSNPAYLALDVPGARMFWTEGGAVTHRIRRATTAGGSVTTLPPVINTYGGIAYIANGTVSTPENTPPTAFALDRLWPSPAREGVIHVEYSIPREATGRLSVIDLQGREIAVLADGVLSPGRHEQLWNARVHTAPAGIYFVRLAVDRRVWTRRIALIP
jgi:DNA-binding beta-propeller fold protein YncE